MKLESLRKHWRIYRDFVVIYLKSRLIYRIDFALGLTSQLVSLIFSVAFLTLIFTQVDAVQGWSFNELLLLAGFSGLILNLHHIFFFGLYKLGEDYILKGRLDRLLVRPLNPLFQVYASHLSDDNISKFLANVAIAVYAAFQIGLSPSPIQIIYSLFAIISGILVIGAIFVSFATTAFWTGRSQAAFWLFFRLSDFRRYPYTIYPGAVKILLITLMPIAYYSFFPTTFIVDKGQWLMFQILSILAGPVLFLIAYQFWKFGLANYSSTGS